MLSTATFSLPKACPGSLQVLSSPLVYGLVCLGVDSYSFLQKQGAKQREECSSGQNFLILTGFLLKVEEEHGEDL